MLKHKISLKCRVRVEIFSVNNWAGRQTNIMKLIVTFCNFTEAPKNDLPRENYYSTTTSGARGSAVG